MQPKPNETGRIHIWVTGRVQGVGFRDFVQKAGVRLALTGWVRNVGYDSVETVAEGPHDRLQEFAGAVKTGPGAARVDDAKIEWEQFTGEFQKFGVKYSL